MSRTESQDDMLLVVPRPSDTELLRAWKSLMNDPLLSMSSCQQQAFDGRIDKLRSVYWRHFFSLLPSPAAPSSSTHSTYKLALERTRAEYIALRDRFIDAPVYDKDVPTSINNPLSLESEDKGNRFAAYFDDLELRRLIKQDCQRTFPDIAYFRSEDVQEQMTELLFLYAKCTPEIGYRQGLHELLGPVLWAVDYDSLETDKGDWLAGLVLSREHVAHDTYALFSAIMRGAKVLYDFVPSVPQPVERNTPVTGAMPASSATSLVQPIVAIANRVHDKLLRTIDTDVWQKMESLRIEPQIFAIRWLRLLFGREFPISDVYKLWDSLFAEDPSLRLIEHVCIAMLLRIREDLLVAEYSTFIQLLLRYPAPPDGDYRIPLLMQQAIMLRDNPSHTTAEICIAQNFAQGACGEPVTSARTNSPDTERWRPNQINARRKQQQQRNSVNSPAAALLAEGGGFVGDIAKGVYGRAEALGINKALFGTFQELRVRASLTAVAAVASATDLRRKQRNLQQPPLTAPRELTSPTFPPTVPTATATARQERPSATAHSRAMAKAIELCTDVLEKAVLASASGTVTPRPELYALTALRHIQDVLERQGEFDASVMSPVIAASSSTTTRQATSDLRRTDSNTSVKSMPVQEPPQTTTASSKDPLGALS